MEDLAHKLMTLHRSEDAFVINPGPVLSVFSFLKVDLPLLDTDQFFRVGIWPCQSDTEPEVAMGLMTILSYLLTRWHDIKVYRLFVALEGEPADYTWALEDSQFGIDDWELDGLDENVAIWGSLERTDGRWSFELEVENDFADADEPARFTYEAGQLSELIGRLPQVAADVAAYLDTTEPNFIVPVYSLTETDNDKLATLLREVFHWEVNLLLKLWGSVWDQEQVTAAHEQMLNAGQNVQGDFGAWCVSFATSRAMMPGYDPVGEWLVSATTHVFGRFPDSPIPTIFLATGLFGLDYVDEACELLESNLEVHSKSVESWIMLAELYRRTEDISLAIDAFQRALEAGATNVTLYTLYAELLLLISEYDTQILDEFVLVDPDEKRDRTTVWEAIEAYQEILKLIPDQINALYRQTIHLADVGTSDPRLWTDFRQLVKLDHAGERVRHVLEALSAVDDLTPAITTLKDAVKQSPGRYDLHINLAAAYLTAQQGKPAHDELVKAQKLSDDPVVLADISRLMLAADDPDFEAQFGEITDLISAGTRLSAEDVDFLEEVIEKAPKFPDGYLMLAKGYQGWDELSAALETLLDAHKELPNDPEIIELLARVLWDSGEEKLAIDYLNKGLNQNPYHVPLLALAGRYLFEDEQEEAAKSFLVRAEMIAPRHPALNAARLFIARMVAERTEEEES